MGIANAVAGKPALDPLVSVIVPVFNEVATVNEVISRVLALPFRKEIIVVDDGSTDGTRRTLAVWKDNTNVRAISHAQNMGKGAAIRTALRVANGTFTLIQDADLEYAPEELPHVLRPLLDGQTDIVYGSRYTDVATRHPHFVSHYGVKALNCLIYLLYRVRLTDHATCYKAFRTELLRRMNLQCEGFEFCTEVTAKACRLHVPIMEVPIGYIPRDYAQGKKIGPLDGVRSALSLFRHRLWLEGANTSSPLLPVPSEVPMASNV